MPVAHQQPLFKGTPMAKHGGRGYSANDMRSMAMNPNNGACQAAQANHANQLNSQHPAYAASRSAEVPVAAKDQSQPVPAGEVKPTQGVEATPPKA